jgi:23S rRNA G2445 N2-methylase RlmL
MSRSQRYTLFATCAPGVEGVLHSEIRPMRFSKVERQVGGVRFEGTIEDAWRANLHLRTAVRILLRLGRFQARGGDALYRGVQEIDWRRFMVPEGSLVVAAQTKDSALDHSLFIEQRTKDAIVDQFAARDGVRPSVDKESPDAFIHVHLFRDRCTVSVDTAGASLHKRGWRSVQGRAPLAETLAAAIVLLSEWDGRAPLIDPFCGSGTILIEAALIAMRVPPGIFRQEFGFERFPGHDADAWQRMWHKASDEIQSPRKLTLLGSDRDATAIEGARQNLASAGLADHVDLQVADALSMEFRAGWNGWIVTNPPYGERVGSDVALTTLYRKFGELLKESASGYRLAMLSGNPELSSALDLRVKVRDELSNGPISCELLRLRVPGA